MVFQHSQQNIAKKHRFHKVFEHSGCKNQGKPMVFQHFQQNITKSTGFIRFSSTLDAKTKKNKLFFNMFSKILQKALVFQCFLQSEFKKQRKTNGFALRTTLNRNRNCFRAFLMFLLQSIERRLLQSISIAVRHIGRIPFK